MFTDRAEEGVNRQVCERCVAKQDIFAEATYKIVYRERLLNMTL